jgi:dTDP-4-amino-4,6-dideoxygalactose transaminase
MCGVKHAIAVASGTTALHSALLAHGIGPGDEVITTPFTFIATIDAILYVGARPVFVDIDETTFNMDLSLLEACITPRTKAILPVHLYGYVCDMDRMQAIADKYGLVIIEDACQAVMASYNGRLAGSFGTGAFSFYATKNMTCGEGGMVTTNDDAIADKCRLIRNHGTRQRYSHEMLGYNFLMTDVEAAIGLVQLQRLPEFCEKRARNAAYFSASIESVTVPQVKPGYRHVWHQYTVRVDDGRNRDAAVEQLRQAGITAGVYYPIPAHRQPHVQAIVGDVSLLVVERLADEVMSLPVHTHLTQADLDVIVTEVNKL